MQEPNLNGMWETFIRIGLPNTVSHSRFYDMIRSNVHPTIFDLKQKEIIDWHCFLVHNRDSGVPTTEDDDNLYFHIRISLKKDVNPEDFLPKYCLMTRKVKPDDVKQIWITENEVMDTSKFKTERIEEAWRIIGEQSEWFLNMLDSYKENVEITPKQVGPFLHYFSNMMGL